MTTSNNDKRNRPQQASFERSLAIVTDKDLIYSRYRLSRQAIMKKIPLSGKIGAGNYAIVDDEDYDRVIALGRWWGRPDGYACAKLTRGRRGKTILMHRLILNPPAHLVVDHVNFVTLDNQRSNLRLCTRAQNNQHTKVKSDNTSGYKGVSWNKEKNKYEAHVSKDGKRLNLGYFISAQDAARSYNAAALELHGEFACLNDEVS